MSRGRKYILRVNILYNLRSPLCVKVTKKNVCAYIFRQIKLLHIENPT